LVKIGSSGIRILGTRSQDRSEPLRGPFPRLRRFEALKFHHIAAGICHDVTDVSVEAREVVVVGFVGGQLQRRFVEQVRDVERDRLLAVPIDVGKSSAAALVCDFWGELVGEPIEFSLNESGFATFRATVARAEAERDAVLVRVGLEQAGHYHQTLLARLEAEALDVVLFNPAQVKENRAQDLLRSVKSDRRDLCAMAELLVRGKGRSPEHRSDALARQAALASHRRRKVKARSALKNQVLGTLDLVFPGLDGCFNDLLSTKVGRVVLSEGLDPTRVRRLGADRLRSFCRTRGVILKRAKADQIVGAARDAFLLPAERATVNARILSADVELLARLDDVIWGWRCAKAIPTSAATHGRCSIAASAKVWWCARSVIAPTGWRSPCCAISDRSILRVGEMKRTGASWLEARSTSPVRVKSLTSRRAEGNRMRLGRGQRRWS
jgi:transposase